MDWFSIMANYGVAIACLVALGLAVWRAMIYLTTNIIKPLVDRHLKFLDELSTALSAQSQALLTMSLRMDQITAMQERHEKEAPP